ncbi:MAG: YoaK family protein [bacterium]|nr:YoaK family protein [bacterium]
MKKLPKIKLLDLATPSESFLLAVILAAAGGFLDGYTFIGRGNVFANTQTGNLILLGVNLAQGKLAASISYLVPVTAFLLGTVITERIRIRCGAMKHLDWRQIVVAAEALVLVLISFMPHYGDNAANAMVSFACAMQFDAFRSMNGVPFTSTLAMMNLRGAVEYVMDYHEDQDMEKVSRSFEYLITVIIFTLSVVIGSRLTYIYDDGAILFPAFMLLLGALLMFFKKRQRPEQA